MGKRQHLKGTGAGPPNSGNCFPQFLSLHCQRPEHGQPVVSFECRCIRGRERSARRSPTLGRNTGKILRLEITGLAWSWVPPSHLRHSCGFSNDRNQVLKRMLTEMAVKGASSPGAESLAPRFTLTPRFTCFCPHSGEEGRYPITPSALMGLERYHPCSSR